MDQSIILFYFPPRTVKSLHGTQIKKQGKFYENKSI